MIANRETLKGGAKWPNGERVFAGPELLTCGDGRRLIVLPCYFGIVPVKIAFENGDSISVDFDKTKIVNHRPTDDEIRAVRETTFFEIPDISVSMDFGVVIIPVPEGTDMSGRFWKMIIAPTQSAEENDAKLSKRAQEAAAKLNRP